MGVSIRGFALIAIMLGSVSMIPAFADCPPDCAPKANYQVGANGTFTTMNNTASVPTSVGTMSTALSVTTDKPSYNDGEKITISGTSRDYIAGTPVSVIIRNPIGNVVYINQLDLNTDKTYSTTITAGGSLWQAAGTYAVLVQYGGQERSAKTTFDFSGSTASNAGNTIAVDGTNFSVTYTITNGKVLNIKADSQSKSLIVSIQSNGDGVLTITMPRALIDAKKSDGTDDQFFVLNNDQENDFASETSTTAKDRTLSIPFTYTTDKIEILGTVVVPEFGPIAALVFAIAIISIIAVSTKAGFRFTHSF